MFGLPCDEVVKKEQITGEIYQDDIESIQDKENMVPKSGGDTPTFD